MKKIKMMDRNGSSFVASKWARGAGLAGLMGIVAFTSQCSLSGLDAYSAEYGKTSAGGGGNGGNGGAGGTGGNAGAPPVCDCAVGQECVLGQCETCTPTWSYDHKALRQGDDIIVQQLLDAPRHTVYVTSSRQDGQGPRRGYMAALNTCRGTVLHEFDNPVADDGTTVAGLQHVGRHGDLLFSKLRIDDTTKAGGYAVYDMVNAKFLRTFEWKPLPLNTVYQGAWGMSVSPSGKIWGFGEYTLTGSTTPVPLLLQSDGVSSSCLKDFPAEVGDGRTMAMSNDDVYLTLTTTNPSPQVRVWHFKDSACDVVNCNCPMADELPPLTVPAPAISMVATVAGSVLLVGGFYLTTSSDWGGFLAQYNFSGGTWNSLYTFDQTPLLDGVTAMTTDGSKVYVAMVENHIFGDPSNTKMELMVFGFPITANAIPQKTLQVPSVRAAFGIDLMGQDVILSGYSFSSIADGRTVRCAGDGCP